jgi:hypothetical protein
MYLAPSLVSELVYTICPIRNDVNNVAGPYTTVSPAETEMVPGGGVAPTLNDMLELELVTVLIVVNELQDLKHPFE